LRQLAWRSSSTTARIRLEALPRSPAVADVPFPERLPSSAAQDPAQAADAVDEALTAAAQAERSPAVLAPTVGHSGSSSTLSGPE